MINVLSVDKLNTNELNFFKKLLDESDKGKYQLFISDNNPEEFDAFAEKADIIYGMNISKQILSKAKNCKLIQLPWVGVEYLDYSFLKDFHIPVCNTHSNTLAVAEHALALTLDLSKKISYFDRKLRENDWGGGRNSSVFNSKYLSEMSVCILGYGNIGSKLAKMLSVLCKNVWAVGNSSRADGSITKIYQRNSLTQAFADADIIICTVPLTNESFNMISSAEIESMKDGVLLVNISRAGIFNEIDLFNGIKSGKIGGFASDVWWNEPKNNVLDTLSSSDLRWDFENIVLSPHRADLVEGEFLHLYDSAKNISNIINGFDLINVVDLNKQY